ncbi:MAG TPA: agmatinase [Candidatus Pelethocola excrementipullorum]|nr:agmatinase [Candidatus Pelethocola excrementipullorum]
MNSLNLPITGICSFGKYPICTDLNKLDADVGILGVPYDLGVGFLSGARLAPRRIREASTQYGRGDGGYYDFERDEQLLGAPFRVADCGDADVLHGDVEYSFAQIEEAVRKIVRAQAAPVVIGGDHSISIPVGRALAEMNQKISVVQFDAHLDWTDHVGPLQYGNGSPMRRLSEMDHIDKMAQIGLRGMGSSRKTDYEDAKAYGSVLISAREAHRIGVDAIVDKIPEAENYFLSIDIDGYDMSIAPGVASPYPGGLYFDQVSDIIRGIGKKGNIVGADLVEVAPQYDPTGSTVRLAALTIMNVLVEIAAARNK